MEPTVVTVAFVQVLEVLTLPVSTAGDVLAVIDLVCAVLPLPPGDTGTLVSGSALL